MKRSVLAVVLFLGPPASWAQVEARTATPEEVESVESGTKANERRIESPMLLELPLKSVSGIPAPAWMKTMRVPIWSSSETRRS
jgi:hypothetical protein